MRLKALAIAVVAHFEELRAGVLRTSAQDSLGPAIETARGEQTGGIGVLKTKRAVGPPSRAAPATSWGRRKRPRS